MGRPLRPSTFPGALSALLAVIVLSVAAPAAHAQETPADDVAAEDARPIRKGFGLGAIVGEPTGLTAKAFITREHALQVHAAWDFTDSAFDIILDYLFHIDAFVLDTDFIDLPLYVGAGLKIGQEVAQPTARVFFGVRAVIGIAAEFTTMPMEVFFEAAPVLGITPKIRADVDAGIGIRYFF